MKAYPETIQHGLISIENFPKGFGLRSSPTGSSYIHGDFGIQVAEDGRIWVCVDGVAFLRFKPLSLKEEK